MAKHSVYAASKVFGEEKFHVVLLFLSSRVNVDGTWTAVGVTQDIKLIKDGDEDIIKVSGILQYGGTSEEVKYTKDVITNVTLNGIGITK